MSIVNLASGGLDSTLVGVLTKEQRIKQYPVFIDYGQRSARREWDACRKSHKQLNLPSPRRVDIGGFGALIRSGLTDPKRNLVKDAFTPGRNLLFLLLGGAYATQVGASAVAIGLLDEEKAIFPDQRFEFIVHAERALQVALGKSIRVLAPLTAFTKRDVVQMAKAKGISGTYSCHAGTTHPCGKCIACREFK
jgi:7-cyano-7-deazaguanine synthase